MSKINVLYATKVNLGGWATFTVHLVNLLRNADYEVELLKIGKNTEAFTRPFGEHGLKYRNVAAEELASFCTGTPTIVAALGKHYVDDVRPLLKMDHVGIVVHDTAESTNRMEEIRRPWVIRRSLAPLFEDAEFIRHPYVQRTDVGLPFAKRKGFVATSRVDFDKNTTMILDANRLGAKIDIVGFENRLYTKFKVMPDYPEWVQSPGTHPRSGEASFERLLGARGMVDLTDIKGDGGGTQYTFLEAWNAMAVPVIGTWWVQKRDDMVPGKNCYAVGSAEELAKLVKRWPSDAPQVALAGNTTLRRNHGPSLVPKIIQWLGSV